jgi:hypothetical protein
MITIIDAKTRTTATLMLVVFVASTAVSKQSRGGPAREQVVFATEALPGEQRISNPVPVPNEVLAILQTDEGVKSCLENNPLGPGKQLSAWFIGSQIHLNGPTEVDLIVVPSFHGDEQMCFQTPSGIGTFWVFCKRRLGYELALNARANGLEVKKSRHVGYRDIETTTLGQAGRNMTVIVFRFRGETYQQYSQSDQHRP